MKILITEFMDQTAVDSLTDAFDVVYDPQLVEDPDQIAAQIVAADAIIVRNRTQVTDALLSAGPKVKCVGRLGVGLDNIDMNACAARDVAVFPATGANNLSVAEYVVTSALMLLRGAYFSGQAMRDGAWPRQACAGREVSGKTLGLVGFGAIAQQTAAMAQGLDMQIAAYDPYLPADHPAWRGIDRCELPDLLAKADVLSLHTPLTQQTKHLINAEAMAAMKPGSFVVNAARGGVVDDTAFANAVRSGHLGGGALDVFETEPLTQEAAQVFDGLPTVILTPHVAGVTEESNVRVSSLTAQTVRDHLTGNSVST